MTKYTYNNWLQHLALCAGVAVFLLATIPVSLIRGAVAGIQSAWELAGGE